METTEGAIQISVIPEPTSQEAAKPLRIGVLLGDLGKLNRAALTYLIVHLNTLQQSFEFEVLPTAKNDPLVGLLKFQTKVRREDVNGQLQDFWKRTNEHLTQTAEKYKLAQKTYPEKYILLTFSQFTDTWHSTGDRNVAVVALGYWDREMAPPSLLEACITLLLRKSLGLASAPLESSQHLGTKGCLFDFTASFDETRYKTLHGFICSDCLDRLKADGKERLAADAARASDAGKWIGKTDDPLAPAGIVAKLGYDLFLTRGVAPTVWQKVKASLRDEAVKELIKVFFLILGAALLLWLGLKKG
jgi:hypothetical protein